MMKQFITGLFLACLLQAAFAQTFPGSVSDVKVTVKSTAIKLAWTAPTDTGGSAIKHYKILYNEVTSLTVLQTTTTDTFVDITGLTNNVNYAFRILAVNNAGFETQTAYTVTATPVLDINAGNDIKQPTFVDLGRRYTKQSYFKACYDSAASTTAAKIIGGASSTKASSDACRTACDDETTCKAYEFNEYGTKCTLYNALPAASDLFDQAGTNCYTLIDTCAADPLNTNLSPYLHATTKFKSDVFSLVIAIPTSYQFSNFTFVASDGSNCNGNSGWTSAAPTDATTDKCTNLFSRNLNWANLYSKCGASRSQDDKFVSFRFNIRLDSAQDIYSNLGAEEQVFQLFRPVSHTLPLIVKFPRFIDVTTSGVNVTNVLEGGRIPGQAALISSIVNATATRADVTLDLEILSLVTYPDYIGTPVVVSTPTSIDATIGKSFISTNDCSEAPGQVCRQFWHVKATNGAQDRCDFNGAYTFRFPYKCQASYSGGSCPEDTMTITINIKTLDHCPKITTASLRAEMATYQDRSFAYKTVSYKLRDIVYAHFETSSDTASIKSTKLKNIVLRQPGYDDIPMWDNFATTSNGTKALCAVWNSESTVYGLNTMQARFSCKLLPSQVILPSMARRTITWYALAEVEYANTAADGTTTTSRRLLAAEFNHRNYLPEDVQSNGQTDASAITSVASDDFESVSVAETVASSASLSAPSLIFSLVAIMASFFAMMM